MNSHDFDFQKIDDVFYVIRNTGSANIGLCMIDQSVLVIDSGYLPRVSAEITAMLENKFGCQVELLFNTHYHADHTFGNQSFACPILSSRQCAETMRACLTSHWAPGEIARAKQDDPALVEEWKNLKITFPTITFDRSKDDDFHGIQVTFERVGGHTPDSSVAYFPDKKILFAGDIVFGQAYPTLLEHDGNPVDLVTVLQRIYDMQVDIIIPGHGPPCGKKTVVSLIAYWTLLLELCQSKIESGHNNEQIIEKLIPHAQLTKIPFNKRKHARNIGAVCQFLRKESLNGGTV